MKGRESYTVVQREDNKFLTYSPLHERSLHQRQVVLPQHLEIKLTLPFAPQRQLVDVECVLQAQDHVSSLQASVLSRVLCLNLIPGLWIFAFPENQIQNILI